MVFIFSFQTHKNRFFFRAEQYVNIYKTDVD